MEPALIDRIQEQEANADAAIERARDFVQAAIHATTASIPRDPAVVAANMEWARLAEVGAVVAELRALRLTLWPIAQAAERMTTTPTIVEFPAGMTRQQIDEFAARLREGIPTVHLPDRDLDDRPPES